MAATAEYAAHPVPLPQVNPWLIAVTVMLATFMEVLDTSVANVSLPHIAGNLSAGVDESTWVLTSYLVSNAIVLPLTGWFSALFGRKRFFIGCVVIFTLSSLLCGLAPSLPMLVLFRVIQGAGGGGMQPISQAILVDSFPREKQGMAMAIYGMGVVVAPTIGPTLGGWITDNYSWRWIFLLNVPVGVISLLMISAADRRSGACGQRRLQEGTEDRLHRARTASRRAGIPADRAGQGRARRLVRLAVHPVVHRGRSVAALIALVIRELYDGKSGDRFASVQGPEFRDLHVHDVHARVRAVQHHGAASDPDADADGLYGDAKRPGAAAGRVGVAVASCRSSGWLLGKFEPRWIVITGPDRHGDGPVSAVAS